MFIPEDYFLYSKIQRLTPELTRTDKQHSSRTGRAMMKGILLRRRVE
jgi:hypothetical protein